MGLLLGLIRLVLDFIYPQPRCDQPDERPAVVRDVHYLYFSMILSSVTLVTVSTVSWCTAPPTQEMVFWGLMLHPSWWVAEDNTYRLKPKGLVVQKLESPGLGFRKDLISGH